MLWIIGVKSLRPATALQIGTLLKLIVANLVHIVVDVGLVIRHMIHQFTKIVAVGDILLIGIIAANY